MTPTVCPFGFRLTGGVAGERRPVDAAVAFAAHCRADPRSDPTRECYLSAFRFGDEFRDHMSRHGGPKGFAGPCWSPWLWADIDRPDPDAAADAARRLVGFALLRYQALDEGDVLVFYTGRKGYHVGLPLGFDPAPAADFSHVCRQLAAGLAAGAGVGLDPAVYQTVQPLRAPNSRHPKTGRHKRRLTVAELTGLTAGRHAELATGPAGFDPPDPAADPDLEADWRDAAALVADRRHQRRGREAPGAGRLQRDTLAFLADPPAEGERTIRLFRAAADLAEHGAPAALVGLLLTDAALDTGLPPAEVARVIGCGVAHAGRQRVGAGGAP